MSFCVNSYMEEMLEEAKNRLILNKIVHKKLFVVIAKINRINNDLEYSDSVVAEELTQILKQKKWIKNFTCEGYYFESTLYSASSHLLNKIDVQLENMQFFNRYDIPKYDYLNTAIK